VELLKYHSVSFHKDIDRLRPVIDSSGGNNKHKVPEGPVVGLDDSMNPAKTHIRYSFGSSFSLTPRMIQFIWPCTPTRSAPRNFINDGSKAH